MAIANITATEILKSKMNATTTLVGATAIDATYGAKVMMDYHDDHFIIIATNTAAAAKTLVVKKGDNDKFAIKDLSLSIPASASVVIMLDSIKYKKTSGVDKNTVYFTGPADVTLQVIKVLN